MIANFRVLRRHEPASQTQGLIQAQLPTTWGAPDFTRTRLAETRGNDEIFLVPTSGGLCIASTSNLEKGCAQAILADQGQLGAAVTCSSGSGPRPNEIFGALPDDATHPTLVYANGARRPVDVTNNVYVIRVPPSDPLPTGVTFLLNGRVMQHALGAAKDVRVACR